MKPHEKQKSTPLNVQEEAFVKAFIVKGKQERYLTLLAGRKRREILDRFNHVLDFEPKFAAVIPREMRTVEKVTRLLRERGAAQTCHVMVDSLDIDGEDLPLEDALAQVIAHDFGSVLCCLPGRLAFHKAEAIEQSWYVFERPQQPQNSSYA